MNRFVFSLLSLLTIGLLQARADSAFRDGDVFELHVSGPPEELTREFNLMLTVDEGAVNLPLIGRIPARGLSSSKLATVIETRLKQAKIFSVATVNITLKETPRTIIVGGSVRSPGRQPWIADLTLTGAISAAAGRTEYATDGIKVTRGGKVQPYSWKLITRDPSKDPKIEAGDSIFVEGT